MVRGSGLVCNASVGQQLHVIGSSQARWRKVCRCVVDSLRAARNGVLSGTTQLGADCALLDEGKNVHGVVQKNVSPRSMAESSCASTCSEVNVL